MSFKESIQQRYTTKEYDGSKKLDSSTIEDLKEILRMSPSSINSQPWKFFFVSDQEVKKNIAAASRHNEERVLDCDTVVVFCRVDNVEMFEEDIAHRLPEGSVGYYNAYKKPGSNTETREWFGKQVYLALGMFLAACAEMKIDSTPMEGIDASDYDEILGVKDYKTIVAVAIGYRNPDDFNQPAKKPKTRKNLEDVIVSI